MIIPTPTLGDFDMTNSANINPRNNSIASFIFYHHYNTRTTACQ
jgi:hypothetical protein